MSNWEPIPTPNPAEFGIRVWASPQQVLGKMGTLAVGVTTLKAFGLATAPASEGIGDYVYVKCEGARADGYLGFIFGKPKTEAEKMTPFHTWTEMGNHYWHPVLKRVQFYPDMNFPVSTSGPDGGIILAPRLYARITFIPGVSEGTLFQHELFFSPTKFEIGQYPVPVPTAVSWDYHDAQGSFPECLHGRLRFPAMRTATAAYSSGGGAVAASGAAPGQMFPATNFEDWQPYVLSFKQDELPVGWLAHRISLTPPSQPDAITR